MHNLFNLKSYGLAFTKASYVFYRNRHLIALMTKRELIEPYAGQILNRFWTIGHPLFLMVLYTFVFNFVFSAKMGGTGEFSLDYTVYILSGLVPWICFQQSLVKGCAAITANASFVKQIVFPIEILPIKASLSSLVAFGIGIIFLFVYTIIKSGTIQLTWFLLPLAIIIQIFAMLGVSYLLAALSVFIKDIKDLVQLFTMVNLFLMPVIYLPEGEGIPRLLKGIFYLNPFSYMGWVYQDIFYFGSIEHPVSWIVFSLSSFFIFACGYEIFSRLKPYFGNYL